MSTLVEKVDSPSSNTLKGIDLIILDDEEILLKLWKKGLEKYFKSVETFSCAKMLIDYIETFGEEYNGSELCFLVDYKLMNGCEDGSVSTGTVVLKQLRELIDEKKCRAYYILISGNYQPINTNNKPYDLFIRKPVGIPDLLQQIYGLVKQKEYD